MNKIENILKQHTLAALQHLYEATVAPDKILVSETKKEFEGDLTIVVFPFVKMARKKPEMVGEELGAYLKEHVAQIADFNVIKGFLNLVISDTYWLDVFNHILADDGYGQLPATNKKVVLEYIGPNTNKPLHLGHLRNMFVGNAVANILAAYGHEVHKVNIYNDRGIAVCKSMIAWQLTAEGATPERTGMKSDHFVGKYYVKFDEMYNAEVAKLVAKGMSTEEAKKDAPILKAAYDLLRKWEEGDEATIALWKQMNQWVYDGFNTTYKSLGIDYEKAYKESEFYKSGKSMVIEGLEKNLFYQKEDKTIMVDLTEEKLDHKVLLRSDDTSIYITQDMGVAQQRYEDYKMDTSIYVVGDEQEYHFKVLKAILHKMGKPYAKGIYHLSYGMVDLPSGKMKSREGTVVDADDLVQTMLQTAADHTKNLGQTEGFDDATAKELYDTIGLGALKYFILKVNAKKRMLFNPQESIDFLGHTGPFVQYSHARIQSILRKYEGDYQCTFQLDALHPIEKKLVMMHYKYPEVIQEAAQNYDPSTIANYAFYLAKFFNKFWAELPILNNETEEMNAFRVAMCFTTGKIIKSAMQLLGIKVPDRM